MSNNDSTVQASSQPVAAAQPPETKSDERSGNLSVAEAAKRLLNMESESAKSAAQADQNAQAQNASDQSVAPDAAQAESAEADATVIAQFRTYMDNDLDTSSAMALIFDAVRRANIAAESGDAATTAALASAVTEMTQALGLKLSAGDDIDAAIVERANALDAARKAKDFAQADEIRNELQAAGYVVETTKDGTRVRRS